VHPVAPAPHPLPTPPALAQPVAAPPPTPPVAALAQAFPPPAGETRFRRGEVLVAVRGTTSKANVDAILRQHHLQEAEVVQAGRVGTTWRLWRIPDVRDVARVVRELGAESDLAAVQPNYVYTMVGNESPAAPTLPAATALPQQQYSLEKLHVDATRALATGKTVLVAVIDTAIDENHPDLAGAVEDRFDAIGGAVVSRTHGTSIAGAIGARGAIEGVAPKARILSARACDGETPQCTTLSVVKAIDWAWKSHARVVNMSFAGPQDPAVHGILAAVFKDGVLFVGAAGNSGRNSPPLYPAADEAVLAVTATDANDKPYEKANVGNYIAIAAPGVDVLLPTPHGKYDFESGTSISAALVSGVAALVLERRPNMPPSEMRKLLTDTAKSLSTGDRGTELGFGLVDAQHALSQAGSSLAKN
jgi:subtilisin family serine protease